MTAQPKKTPTIATAVTAARSLFYQPYIQVQNHLPLVNFMCVRFHPSDPEWLESGKCLKMTILTERGRAFLCREQFAFFFKLAKPVQFFNS